MKNEMQILPVFVVTLFLIFLTTIAAPKKWSISVMFGLFALFGMLGCFGSR